MQIDWTAEEREILRDAHDAAEVAATSIGREVTSIACQRQTSEAVASCAVRLFLGRASGQVAEDMARLEKRLEPMDDKSRAAFHRLSALAQESEALEVAEQEIKTLRAKVADLEREEATARAASTEHHKSWMTSLAERDVARAEVDRLTLALANERSAHALEKSERARTWNEKNYARLELARLKSEIESAWSAARKVAPVDKLGVRLCDVVDSLVSDAQRLATIRARAAKAITECRGEGAREILRERLGWVLEGDAANPSIPSNGSGEEPPTIAELEAILDAPEGTYRVEVQPNGEVRAAKRYPCSPTCTHDDAATPGHPERVKERSEAVNDAVDVSADHDWGETEPDPYQRGAEAMRAACWEAVQAPLRILGGVEPGSAIWSAIKTAIENAKP